MAADDFYVRYYTGHRGRCGTARLGCCWAALPHAPSLQTPQVRSRVPGAPRATRERARPRRHVTLTRSVARSSSSGPMASATRGAPSPRAPSQPRHGRQAALRQQLAVPERHDDPQGGARVGRRPGRGEAHRGELRGAPHRSSRSSCCSFPQQQCRVATAAAALAAAAFTAAARPARCPSRQRARLPADNEGGRQPVAGAGPHWATRAGDCVRQRARFVRRRQNRLDAGRARQPRPGGCALALRRTRRGAATCVPHAVASPCPPLQA